MDIDIDQGADFLPHTKSMRFVDRVLSFDLEQKAGIFSITLDAKKPYFSKNESFQSVWLIEMLAQAAAGVFYFIKSHENKSHTPIFGFLVGVESFSIDEPVSNLKPGSVLRLEAKMNFDFFPFGIYTCSAHLDENVLAKGTFKFVTQEKESSH